MTKTQTKIMQSVQRGAQYHVSWGNTYGQRVRNAAYLLQAAELVRVTDVRTIGTRTLAIIVAA